MYLMLQEARTSPRLKGSPGVSQDDAFTSSIKYILIKLLEVLHISTHFPRCDVNMFPGLLTESLDYKRIGNPSTK